MANYFKIKPIRVGELQEKEANAIMWYVSNLTRNADFAIAQCSLVKINDDGSSVFAASFQVEIDNATLQSWGSDDTVIDNVVLAYSPLFIKD